MTILLKVVPYNGSRVHYQDNTNNTNQLPDLVKFKILSICS